MKLLPFDVCYIIWTMCGRNAVILNKDLIPYLEKIKIGFVKSPLVIKYRLIKFKEIQNQNGFTKRPRASIKVDKVIKTLLLNGKIPLGIIRDGIIEPSLKICDEIIPCSHVKIVNGIQDSRRYNVVYWKIFEIYCDNIKRSKIYNNLFS
jgi:hypothetical protein